MPLGFVKMLCSAYALRLERRGGVMIMLVFHLSCTSTAFAVAIRCPHLALLNRLHT